jgi:hypothetical protein
MSTNHTRKLLLSAVLAAALAAPAFASDGLATMQMAQVGQGAPDMAAIGNGPSIAQEALRIPTQVSLSEPSTRQRVSELRPATAGIRQPAASVPRQAAPRLILGIGY